MKPVLDYSISGRPMLSAISDVEITLAKGETIAIQTPPGACWYGHGFSHRQPYPLNRETVSSARFAVNNIQSPIWMCSAGFAILGDTGSALEVSVNADVSGCLSVRCAEQPVALRFFVGESLPAAWRRLMQARQWPPASIQPRLFGDSIFCTWTQYPRCITQERIIDMARQIRAHDYPCSVMTIDDRWESGFGELTFSADFPNPHAMVEELHGMGFDILLWVTPFVNQETARFAELSELGYLVGRSDGVGGPV
jgi:alpha-glucosidase (family GH31 glycosyl hydrolase)